MILSWHSEVHLMRYDVSTAFYSTNNEIKNFVDKFYATKLEITNVLFKFNKDVEHTFSSTMLLFPIFLHELTNFKIYFTYLNTEFTFIYYLEYLSLTTRYAVHELKLLRFLFGDSVNVSDFPETSFYKVKIYLKATDIIIKLLKS